MCNVIATDMVVCLVARKCTNKWLKWFQLRDHNGLRDSLLKRITTKQSDKSCIYVEKFFFKIGFVL